MGVEFGKRYLYEVARLDPPRPAGRDKKGVVTKSAKELEAELKLLTGGQAALIARLLGFDGEKKATPFRMQVHVEAAATVAAPTATTPPISTAVAKLTVIESDDDAGMSDEDDECGGVGGGDGSGGGALGLEKGAQQQQQRASTPPRAQPQLQPSPRSRGPRSGRSPANSPVKVKKSARQALRHGTGSSV